MRGGRGLGPAGAPPALPRPGAALPLPPLCSPRAPAPRPGLWGRAGGRRGNGGSRPPPHSHLVLVDRLHQLPPGVEVGALPEAGAPALQEAPGRLRHSPSTRAPCSPRAGAPRRAAAPASASPAPAAGPAQPSPAEPSPTQPPRQPNAASASRQRRPAR